LFQNDPYFTDFEVKSKGNDPLSLDSGSLPLAIAVLWQENGLFSVAIAPLWQGAASLSLDNGPLPLTITVLRRGGGAVLPDPGKRLYQGKEGPRAPEDRRRPASLTAAYLAASWAETDGARLHDGGGDSFQKPVHVGDSSIVKRGIARFCGVFFTNPRGETLCREEL
jgi:hypothetical protein